MRSGQLARLLFIGCVVVGWNAQPSVAETKKPQAGRSGEAMRKPWSKKVEGRADTLEIADRVALLRAQDELEQYLRSQRPALHHMPSEDYVHANLIKKVAEKELKDHKENNKDSFLVVLEVSFADKNYQELLHQEQQLSEAERQERIQERMFWLAKLLAGIVALLAAVTGYFRLEEATRGYYTAWLRLGAIGFVVAVCAGLWWIS